MSPFIEHISTTTLLTSIPKHINYDKDNRKKNSGDDANEDDGDDEYGDDVDEDDDDDDEDDHDDDVDDEDEDEDEQHNTSKSIDSIDFKKEYEMMKVIGRLNACIHFELLTISKVV